jgi:hypothetical protein
MNQPYDSRSGSWIILNDGRIKITRLLRSLFFGSIKGNELIMVTGNEQSIYQKLK